MQAVDADEVKAVKFLLETRCRPRGYSRRPLHLLPSDPMLLSDYELNWAISEIEKRAVDVAPEPVAEPPRALPGPTMKKRSRG